MNSTTIQKTEGLMNEPGIAELFFTVSCKKNTFCYGITLNAFFHKHCFENGVPSCKKTAEPICVVFSPATENTIFQALTISGFVKKIVLNIFLQN